MCEQTPHNENVLTHRYLAIEEIILWFQEVASKCFGYFHEGLDVWVRISPLHHDSFEDFALAFILMECVNCDVGLWHIKLLSFINTQNALTHWTENSYKCDLYRWPMLLN